MEAAANPRWRTCAALSRPLTILGVERSWFLLAAFGACALFNLLKTLAPSLVFFVFAYLLGRWALRVDPHFLRVLRAARKAKKRYDPGKPARVFVRVEP